MTEPLTTEGTIHVLIADEQVLVRKGVCALLAAEPGIDVIGETGAPGEAIGLVEQQGPDVVLLDLAWSTLAVTAPNKLRRPLQKQSSRWISRNCGLIVTRPCRTSQP